ncbi:MAG: FtsX-like permease family protein [Spirochaetota bacterium]
MADADAKKITAARQKDLSFGKTVAIAWKNIRIRWLRSMLVTTSIVFSLAFLTYSLGSDVFVEGVMKNMSPEHIQKLVNTGVLNPAGAESAKSANMLMVVLALLICFVGILNAMIMSVTERFREIGTMKCLGALDSFIIKWFLLETVMQGIIGSLIGLAVGFAVTFIGAWATFGNILGKIILPDRLLTVAGICFITGVALAVLGALYPAWQAAKMLPSHAMRSEL